MKKIFILSFFSVNIAFGQSVTISPLNPSHIEISKQIGTAKLSLNGIGDGFNAANSEISLSNNAYLGNSATNTINFNNSYSIKNTFTPNLAGPQSFFGIYHGTTPMIYYGGTPPLSTMPISISYASSELLTLNNTNSLANNVRNEIFFKTGSYYTGAIKTIGTSASFARMGFFTYTDQSSNNLVERLSIIDGGNVGIGTTTPQTALHVIGNVRSSNLVGTGTRNVYADASGTLTTAQQTRTLMLSQTNFVLNSNDATTYAFGYAGNNGITISNSGISNSAFASQLNLPHGAIVTNVSFYYTDQDGGANLQFQLYRTSFADNSSFLSIVNINTSAQSGSDQVISTNTNFTIDETKVYQLTVENVTGNWSPSLRFKGVKITYTL